jgi:prepilin-type N-terminal cleavage/methylation domain-containing protein
LFAFENEQEKIKIIYKFNLNLNNMKKNKGFTLIELLVVIAIIGLLSTIVLVSLNSARNKAKDTRIIADLSQIRNIAELIYSDTNSYATLTTSDSRVKSMSDDITAQGQALNIPNPGATYYAWSKLNSGKYACVDDVGNSETTLAQPPTGPACK